MKRKHDAMYAEYGKDYAHTCKQCTNCVYNTWDKRYYKCLRYGDSASEIRARWQGGVSMTNLGKEYGVARQTISNIVHRRKWRRVNS